MILSSSLWGEVLRVRTGASGGGNGSSWTLAFANLQDALAAASTGDEIWVAVGTYTPDIGAGQTPGDTSARFDLKEGVAIYGGFPFGGSGFDNRDPVANPTILSADLGGATLSGVLIEAKQVDNTTLVEGIIIRDAAAGAVRIVEASPIFRDCVFRNNAASGQGAAARITDQSNPSFFNCNFIENSAVSPGGAVSLGDSGATFEDCLFEDNSSNSDGGAVYMNSFFGTPANFTRCEFLTNSSDRQGGAIAFFNGNQNFDDCSFDGNTSTANAGTIFSQDSTTNFIDCGFANGQSMATFSSEGIRFRGVTSTIERSTFTGFTTTAYAIFALPNSGSVSNLTIIDSSFDGNGAAVNFSGRTDGTLSELIIRSTSFENHSASGSSVISASDTKLELTDSDFVANAERALNVNLFSSGTPPTVTTTVTGTRFEGNGDGIFNDSSELTVTDCQFIANDDSGLRVSSDTPTATISDSTFTDNGGAALSLAVISSTVQRCVFSGNLLRGMNFRGDSLTVSDSAFRGNSSGTFAGGAAQLSSNDAATASFRNCLFSGNQSDNRGSALDVRLGQLDLINCTFSGNASGQDGTIYVSEGDVRFKNTLIHRNNSGFPDDSSERPESSIDTDFDYPDSLTFERSMVDNFSKADLDALSTTFDNYDSFDPRFASELDPSTAPATGGDFQLSDGSPAINAGSNLAYTSVDGSANPVDLAGAARIMDLTIDLGAYEFTPNPFAQDPDFDGIPTGLERALGTNPNLYDLNDPAQFRQAEGSADTVVFGYDPSTAPTIVLELRRSTDLIDFDVVLASSETGFPTPDTAGLIILTDPNPPAGKAFYRLEAREK